MKKLTLSRKKKSEAPSERKILAGFLADVKKARYQKGLFRHFEWPLFLMVMAMSLWGVVSIFAATGSPIENAEGMSFLEKIRTQSFYYPRLQLIWVFGGVIVMAVVVFFDYRLYGQMKDLFYWGNVALLLAVKTLTVAGGAARDSATNMFFSLGERTFQPAELGKICIIIALAKIFSNREKPIKSFWELFGLLIYVGLPLALIIIQPDIGTALVYVVIFSVMVWASGTNYKLIVGALCIAVIVIVPTWYLLNFSDNFRIDRIQVWLDPNYDINDAGLQTYNARLALGSGGLLGKGLFAEGNFAAMNYVPDDHTDFIFAVVGETFGFVGAAAMVLLFLLMLLRMVVLARRAEDSFGCYLIIGVMAMMFFHVFENISMVIGLMPVTGIPLPFVSYGGSSYFTNIIGIGMVINVAMRSKAGVARQPRPVSNPAKLIR